MNTKKNHSKKNLNERAVIALEEIADNYTQVNKLLLPFVKDFLPMIKKQMQDNMKREIEGL